MLRWAALLPSLRRVAIELGDCERPTAELEEAAQRAAAAGKRVVWGTLWQPGQGWAGEAEA